MAPPVRRRTRARELALRFLYSVELRGQEALDELDAYLAHHDRPEDEGEASPPSPDRAEITAYARTLIEGTLAEVDLLNRWIEAIARNWRLDRMAHLDRNVLRLAMYELLFRPEVPFKVVINEAIDIAKRYSTAQSGSFVNGILDRARILIQEARGDDDQRVPDPPTTGRGPGGSGGGGGSSTESSGKGGEAPLMQAAPAHQGPRRWNDDDLAGAPMPRPRQRHRPQNPPSS